MDWSHFARWGLIETIAGRGLRGVEPVHLGSEDEIALGKAVYLVGEDGDPGATPAEVHIRVVGLLLGQLADPIHEVQRLPEVREAELLPQ